MQHSPLGWGYPLLLFWTAYSVLTRNNKKDGTLFVKAITDSGIIPGIKVDTGAKDMASHHGEKIVKGLDG